MTGGYDFVKGHGTENDFVLLPDHDGSVHGSLSPERVRALCDRRAGIGGDGVLRVIRTAAIEPSLADEAEWFLDYRNADGSVGEMCGNGVRVFVRYLIDAGLATSPVPVATRAGVKVITELPDGLLQADMGEPRVLGRTVVSAADHTWTARHINMGNPHAVVQVNDLADAGPLLDSPSYDEGVYPTGVNVEFVVRRSTRHVAMRVHERGSGETRSCGTGACAVAVAAALDDGRTDGEEVTYRVDVPGGRLDVTWTDQGRILMTGPAVIVARGVVGVAAAGGFTC